MFFGRQMQRVWAFALIKLLVFEHNIIKIWTVSNSFNFRITICFLFSKE